MTFQDSGERTEFETGARRDAQDGKGRMDLLPWRAIMEVSKIYEDGCLKYGDRNWEKGIPLSRYADSGPRHFGKWMAGMDDEPHLKMAIWNFLSMLDTILRIKEGVLPETLNDLPCCPDLAPEVTPPIVGDIIDLEKMDEFLFRIGKTKVVAETEWPLDCMPALKAAVEAPTSAKPAIMPVLKDLVEASRAVIITF